MAATTRIYVLKDTAGKESLVNAVSRAAALYHMASTAWSIGVAKQGDIVRVMSAGGKVQTAGDVPEIPS